MKKDKHENPYYTSSLQKTIKKLISEEWFSGQMYKLFINSVDKDEKHLIESILDETANDELNDHMKNLIEIATKYSYDIPSTYTEFKKYANEDDYILFETFKNKKDAEYYLKLSVESELRAIQSYEEALKDKNLHLCQELESILVNNYYDEIEHLRQFDFLLKTLGIDANVQLIQQ